MNIIIVGCGKVGQALVEQLNTTENNITVIDIDQSKIKEIKSKYDVLDVLGNGASSETLQNANVEQANLVIAVTASDELNLLCCFVAKKMSNCQTIARVRNPEYVNAEKYFRDELGLTLIINPEYAAALEVSRVLRFPSAIKIDTLAKGKIELLKFKLPQDGLLQKYTVKDVATKLHCDVLVCTIERGEDIIIPNGESSFKDGDVVSIIATPEKAAEFFKKIHLYINRTKNVLFAGGGEISYYLSKMLMPLGINVKIIEKNIDRCNELCKILPKATIINGDANDRATLIEEGLNDCDGFVALTNLDEENVFLSLYARSVNKDCKIVTKINRSDFTEVIDQLKLDSIVNPKYITAESITRFVRAMSNTSSSNMESLYSLIKGKVEVAEFFIKEKSRIVNVPLQDLKFKSNVLIAGIYRDNKMKIPRGQDKILVGDSVVVVSRQIGLYDIEDILG